MATPLVAATLVALGLNLVFRIGIRRRVTMTIDAATPVLSDVTAFIERSAGAWGARRDVANRLEFAVQQTLEAIIAYCGAKGPIRLDLSFDEFVINADIIYDGKPMEFPVQPPGKDELLELRGGLSAPCRLPGTQLLRPQGHDQGRHPPAVRSLALADEHPAHQLCNAAGSHALHDPGPIVSRRCRGTGRLRGYGSFKRAEIHGWLKEDVRQRAVSAIARRMDHEHIAHSERIEVSYPAEAILRVASEESVDLILPADAPAGAVQRMLPTIGLTLATVAALVVQSAKVPVVIVK